MIFDGGRVKTQDESSREQKEEPLPHQKKTKQNKFTTHIFARENRERAKHKKKQKKAARCTKISPPPQKIRSLFARPR